MSEILSLTQIDRCNFKYKQTNIKAAATLVKASRVELELRNDVYTTESLRYFPATRINGNLHLIDNMTMIQTNSPNCWNQIENSIYQKQILVGNYYQYSPQNIQTYFFLINLYSNLLNWYENPAIDLCLCGMETLAKTMGHTGSWSSQPSDNGAEFKKAHIFIAMNYNGFYSRGAYYPYAQPCMGFTVFDQQETPSYQMMVFDNVETKTVVPVSFYQRNEKMGRLILFTLPKQYEILGVERLNTNSNNAHILVSDEHDLVFNNYRNQDVIILAMPSNISAYDHCNIKPLAGCNVSWLINNFSCDQDEKETFKKAIKFCLLAIKNNVNVNFIIPSVNIPPSGDISNIELKTISKKELVKLSLTKGIDVPDELIEQDSGNISASILEKVEQSKDIIKNVIQNETLTTIYGSSGVGKSQVVISIGIALVAGKHVFADKWRPTDKKGYKVLTIAGEMRKEEYAKRIKIFNKKYKTPLEKKDNFIVNIVNSLDLASHDAFETILEFLEKAKHENGTPGMPVKLLILDNLTTLSSVGEMSGCFGKVESLLKRLMSLDIAILLVHHENKTGGMRGAQKISDISSKVIHLIKGDTEGDKLSLLIVDEKKRSNKPSDVETFKAILDFENNNPWNVVPLSKFSENELTLANEDTRKENMDLDNKISRSQVRNNFTRNISEQSTILASN